MGIKITTIPETKLDELKQFITQAAELRLSYDDIAKAIEQEYRLSFEEWEELLEAYEEAL